MYGLRNCFKQNSNTPKYELVGKNIKPTYTDPRPGDVKHSLADIALAKKLIDYKTKVPFKQGLQLAIDWYRDNLL